VKNYIQEGKIMQRTLTADVLSGGVVLLPSGVGIAEVDGLTGASISVHVEGVFEVAKEAPLVINQGDKLYWDAVASKFTKTATGNTPAGIAFEAAIEAATVVLLKLDPTEVGQAATLAAHGAPAVVATVLTDLATGGGNTYSDAAVNAIFAEVETALLAKSDNADLITVAAKLDDLIAKLKAAGLVANA